MLRLSLVFNKLKLLLPKKSHNYLKIKHALRSNSLLPASVDNFCKQFGRRSEVTDRRSYSVSKPLDILIVFLKDVLEKKEMFKAIGRRQQKTLKITQYATI